MSSKHFPTSCSCIAEYSSLVISLVLFNGLTGVGRRKVLSKSAKCATTFSGVMF